MLATILAATDVSFALDSVFGIIRLVLGLAGLGAGIYTAIDANKYSDQAHQAAGAPKLLWVIGAPLVALICCCGYIFPFIMPALWFGVYKKKVETAQSGGGFGYGGPPPGGGYQPPGGGYPPPPPPGGFGQQ